MSKWKTALNPVRAIQGMRPPSLAQPSPPPTEAAVAKSEPDVKQGKGFKWRTVFHAVRAADDMKSAGGGGGRWGFGRQPADRRRRVVAARLQVLSLLALPVQKYKY